MVRSLLAIRLRNSIFIMAWKVAGELQSPKNITVGSYSPSLVMKVAFHLWPFFIRTVLYPHRMSNFVKRVHPLRQSVSWGISGRGYLFQIVHALTGQ